MEHDVPLSKDLKAPDVVAIGNTETKLTSAVSVIHPNHSSKDDALQSPPLPFAGQTTTPGTTRTSSVPLLAPRDTGFAAWRVLTAAILAQAIPFGRLTVRQRFIRSPTDQFSLQASL